MEAVLNFQPVIALTEEQFFDFCQLNRDVRIERNAKGEVLVMSPTGGATGTPECRNHRAVGRMGQTRWHRRGL